jgi:phosphoglycerol transferase MdoB-like AlkP superfamily enzyme
MECGHFMPPHVDHLVRKFYFRTYTSDAIKMEVLKLKFLFVILVFNLGSLLYISYLHWEIPFLSSLILIIYLSRKKKKKKEFVERKRVQIKYTGGVY